MSEIGDIMRREAGAVGEADADRLQADFARRADDLGLVDVGYATLDSPVGTLVLAATARGLVRLAYGDAGLEPALAELARRVSPRVVELPARLDSARRQLDEYFRRQRSSFDLPLDLRLVTGFGRRVLDALSGTSYGQVRTYRDVARKAGNERAVRATGRACGANPVPIVVPCHRVVRSDGGVGGYTGGHERKLALLRLEGASVVPT